MTTFEILIIAVGLAMDAFAVSVCKGLSVRQVKAMHSLKVGVWFGGFQALMPLVGYGLGINFASKVEAVDHWIAFVLLGLIGASMIREALSKDEECSIDSDFSARAMLPLAIATSFDALAVGVSMAFLGVSMGRLVSYIGIVTCVLSMAGLRLGHLFGCRFKSKAELAGGLILVGMGVKILVEHTIGQA